MRDLGIIVLSVVIAIILVKTDVLVRILTSSKELEIIGTFMAGMFFTSIFTTAPSIVTLGEIARINSVWTTAFFGALGAVAGDLIIFRFVKDKLSGHLIELVKHNGGIRRFKALFKLKFFRWFILLVGGLIIASPLPDELGISLLGFSKMKTAVFLPISFLMNFLGILVIGLVAKGLL